MRRRVLDLAVTRPVASKAPNGAKEESCIKQFARRITNENIAQDLYFVPCAETLLRYGAWQTSTRHLPYILISFYLQYTCT